jgi:hypothetical protein
VTKDPGQHYIEGITLKARHSAGVHAYELALANFDLAAQRGDVAGMDKHRLEAVSLLEAQLDHVHELWVWNRNTPG